MCRLGGDILPFDLITMLGFSELGNGKVSRFLAGHSPDKVRGCSPTMTNLVWLTIIS
jgi:hypothetical protein